MNEQLSYFFEVIKDESGLDSNVLINVLCYLDGLSGGYCVNPTEDYEKLSITERQYLNVLSLLSREEYLETVYKVHCPTCKILSSKLYESISDADNNRKCDKCGNVLTEENFFKNCAVFFRKTTSSIDQTLFDVPVKEPELQKEACKTCEHRQRWECGSRFIQYCGVRKSNRTSNGLLKIKCKGQACKLYKQEK